MAKLTTKERNSLPDEAFALPGRRFPLVDRNHAKNALARADEGLSKGWLTKAEYNTVVAKAKKILGED